MSAAAVLDDLRRRGVVVTVAAGKVVARGPREAITPEIRRALIRSRREILSFVSDRSVFPTLGGAAPEPPQPVAWPTGRDDMLAWVWHRFAEYGTHPAPDDLSAAATQEISLARWREWLDAVYRGEMTLVRRSDGQLSAFPRGLPS